MIRIFGYFCLAVITGGILASAGLLAWFIADRALPVELVSTSIETPEVEPGGKLTFVQELDYKRDCSAHIDRAIYDSVNHRDFLMDIDYSQPPRGLGRRTVRTVVDVPDYFAPGDAEYRALPVYACNPLQQYYWPITRPETVLRFKIKAR